MSIINTNAKGSAVGGFYGHTINQSLRFNDNDSAYLSRTPASAGNRKTATFSTWVKRANIGVHSSLLSVNSNTSGTVGFHVRFDSTSGLIVQIDDGTTSYGVITQALFRDPSAWYHVVVELDTTEASSSNRLKIYVNGVQQSTTTQFGSPPAQNADTFLNATRQHNIGVRQRATSTLDLYLDAYLAETHFIDGQALDADSFGEFKSGVWIPKAYAGSYGTNGFHLDFGNSADLGNDVSGQGNDWTANNLSATDQVLDSPTNNFATLNVIDSESTLSEGNLQQVTPTSGRGATRASFGVSSGKWYWEVLAKSSTGTGALNQYMVGIAGTQEDLTGRYIGETTDSYAYFGYNGRTYNGTYPYVIYGAAYTANDIVGVALDLDTGSLTFYKNNSTQGQAYTGLAGTYAPALSDASDTATSTFVANFGQDSSFAGNKTAQGNTDANGIGDFYYTPPSGYLALCTANLPEPVIGPNSATLSDEHFNTLVWSGDGTNSGRSFTGVGFQPDFMWWKKRSGATVHHLYDSIRGAGNNNELVSNGTGAEGASNAEIYGYLSSFDSDGFTGTAGTDGSFPVDYFNGTGSSYVAWNWKANGSGVSNTDGSITSTVSANTDAGFSIVNWTASGGASTQGHGLSQTPEMIIAKSRDNSDNWWVWFDGYSADEYLVLNGTSAKASYTSIWGETPTSTTFGVTASSFASGAAIAYCFHSVDGFSKFGSYTGNGSTDGPFVFCGFKPAFVMVKRTDATGQWTIWDGERDQHNYAEKTLFPNLSNAEESGNSFERWDLLSNGFKLRSNGRANVSGGTHIFMAFSENPFKYSTGA